MATPAFRWARSVLAPMVLTFSLAGCSVTASTTEAAPATPGGASVVRVLDGDTIIVRLDGVPGGGDVEERVRLIGIDTPESVDPRTPVECFGREAGDRAKALLPEGTAVRLVRDVEARDRYDRLLAYVYRSDDDLFVNRAMVEEGYATPLPYPPNVTHSATFSAAAADARRSGRGLWGACPSPVGR